MTRAALNRSVIEDLFVEQDVEILAPSYKHGICRSVFIVVRSLFLSRPSPTPIEPLLAPGASLAVVFFPNEFHAASQAAPRLGIDHILQLNLHSLAIVRQTLGLTATLREVGRFVHFALKLKGLGYAGRLTQPLLAWLIYLSFRTLLDARPGLTILTTNLQHPSSIAVAWAAAHSGHTSDFLEHATTTRIQFKDRGYRNYHVQFPHTRQMLIDLGVREDRAHALRELNITDANRGPVPVSNVGICVNFFDSIESIVDLTDSLLERKLKPIYRVHDADPRVVRLRELAAEKGVAFDNARDSRIEVFLQRVDLLVAGNSNVVADALIAEKPVIYYWAGDPDMYDYYGIVTAYGLRHASDKAGFAAVLGAAIAG